MNEKERRIVVKRVKKDIQDIEILKSKSKELEELSTNEIIKKYLVLKKEVLDLKNKVNRFDGSLEKIINLEFNWAFASPQLNEYLGSCEHGIWIYDGSYGIYNDYSDNDHEYKVVNENESDFQYNIYCCLECGKYMTTSNWQEFENTHFVLKDRNITNAYEYRYLFYQLLYNHSINKSKELLIKEFNKNSKKLSIKITQEKK